MGKLDKLRTINRSIEDLKQSVQFADEFKKDIDFLRKDNDKQKKDIDNLKFRIGEPAIQKNNVLSKWKRILLIVM